jgi:DNA-binding helix-hairpin-helix protein with protein kinase domain
MRSVIVRQQRLLLTTPLAPPGAQGTVYEHPLDARRCIKVLHAQQPDLKDRIEEMLKRRPDGQSFQAWPLAVAYDAGGQAVGYEMGRVVDGLAMEHILNPAFRHPAIREPFLYRVALSFARALAALHASGYIEADIRPLNLMVVRQGLVLPIDLDSCQFTAAGRLFPACYGDGDYLAPRLQQADLRQTERRVPDDLWSAATVIHKLVRGGEHPFNYQCPPGAPFTPMTERIVRGLWPDSGKYPDVPPATQAPPFASLPMPLQELFFRCFDLGHAEESLRPTMDDWVAVVELLAPRRATISRRKWHACLGPKRPTFRLAGLPRIGRIGTVATIAAAGLLAVGGVSMLTNQDTSPSQIEFPARAEASWGTVTQPTTPETTAAEQMSTPSSVAASGSPISSATSEPTTRVEQAPTSSQTPDLWRSFSERR